MEPCFRVSDNFLTLQCLVKVLSGAGFPYSKYCTGTGLTALLSDECVWDTGLDSNMGSL